MCGVTVPGAWGLAPVAPRACGAAAWRVAVTSAAAELPDRCDLLGDRRLGVAQQRRGRGEGSLFGHSAGRPPLLGEGPADGEMVRPGRAARDRSHRPRLAGQLHLVAVGCGLTTMPSRLAHPAGPRQASRKAASVVGGAVTCAVGTWPLVWAPQKAWPFLDGVRSRRPHKQAKLLTEMGDLGQEPVDARSFADPTACSRQHPNHTVRLERAHRLTFELWIRGRR
jgi:hypothetical protein